jgi:hypothetical protein
MAKVTLYHYNWNKGREIDRNTHFDITFMPKVDAVKRAWAGKLYDPIVETDMNEQDNLLICELVFSDQNRDSPRNWRSMCTGDIVQVDEKYYMCDTFGFKEITFS